MAGEAEARENFSIGQVFSRGFGVIVDNPLPVLGISFLFGALPSMLVNYFFQPAQQLLQMDRDQVYGFFALYFGSLLLSIVLQAFVQGSLVRATMAYTRNERATFGECVSASLAVLPALVVLAILLGLATMIAFMFFFVPGIMLYIMWAVASPALVAERTGVFGAFGRSRYLTRGLRWRVFGVEAILLFVYMIFATALTQTLFAIGGADLTTLATTGLSPGWIISTTLSATVINTVWSTVQTSLYVELRNAKEGFPEESLAEIFA